MLGLTSTPGTIHKIGTLVFFGPLENEGILAELLNVMATIELEFLPCVNPLHQPHQSRLMLTELKPLAEEIVNALKLTGGRVVFAESCTGGLISASLAQIPGVSEFHCGSAVVYRLDTKTRWLGIPPEILINPGPVSEIVARQMAAGVLERTPEADWSASITGHLGPNAPENLDGLVYIGIGRRDATDPAHCQVDVEEHRLGDPQPTSQPTNLSLRERRQFHAAKLVLTSLLQRLRCA